MSKFILTICIVFILVNTTTDSFAKKVDAKNSEALSQYDKSVLITLCENLYNRLDNLNDTLKAVLQKNKDLQKEIKKLKENNTKLTNLNNKFARQIAKQAIEENSNTKNNTKPSLQNEPPDNKPTSNNHNSNYVPLYHYEYSMTLLTINRPYYRYNWRQRRRHSHFGGSIHWHNGGLHFRSNFYGNPTHYWGSYYDHHNILFHLYFTNRDSKPYRFQFEIAIARGGHILGSGQLNPASVAGSALINTKTLAPGETASITRVINVINPLSLGKAKVRNVKGFIDH